MHIKPLCGCRGYGTIGVSNLFPAPATLIRVKLMFSLKVKVVHFCNFSNIDLKLWEGGEGGDFLVVGMPVMFRVKKTCQKSLGVPSQQSGVRAIDTITIHRQKLI